jgi:hypothetical protein
VPLFVLVRVHLGWYALFVAGNLLMYVAIFGVSVWSIEARDVLVTWSVWGRVGTFLLLVNVFLRAPSTTVRPLERSPAANETTVAD